MSHMKRTQKYHAREHEEIPTQSRGDHSGKRFKGPPWSTCESFKA